jgi:lipoprotein-releasing system permease protein
MKLAFQIALRFLTSNKSQAFLITLGIAIGISVQIFIGSLIDGLQVSLVDSTIGSVSQITIESSERNEPLDNYQEIETIIGKNYEEVTAFSPTLTQGGFMLFDQNFDQMLYRGFDINKANVIYKFADAILPGGAMPREGEVLIGQTLANNNDVSVGDTITLISAERDTLEVKVAGLIDLKVASLNELWIVGDMKIAQKVFIYDEGNATAIEMQVEEPFDADILTDRMTEDLKSYPISIANWKTANEQLLSGLSGQTTSSLMIQIFVVISVVLGIASVLAITVLQKSRQIGILKAMGIKDKTSSYIFLFQGFILGILGGILGIILGIGLLFAFSTFALNPDGTPIVPIVLNPGFIALSGMIAVLASTIASIIPAQKSKKVSPIEVIRNG